MAESNADRQAKYRIKKQISHDHKRINTFVNKDAHQALKRLSNRYGVTLKETLEKILIEADQSIVEDMKPRSKEWKEYFNVNN